MKACDQEKLRRDMGEAAVLPPEDPQRRDVEARIAKAGAWAEQEWLAILEEDEHLRLELMRVEAPAGLEERLLGFPDSLSRRRPPLVRRLWWAVAAAVLLVVGGALLLSRSERRLDPSTQVNSLATLALDKHSRDQHVSIETADANLLAEALSAELPFAVAFPQLGPEFRLIGGRGDELHGRPVGYSLWATREGNCALFVFRGEDFDLPDNLGKKRKCHRNLAKPGGPCDVMVWTTGARGYAFVTRCGGDLDQIAARLALALKTERG